MVKIQDGHKRLGAYEVLAKIATGGMATIYLARERDAGELQHIAAIKVIRDELAHLEDYVQMFGDEAKVLSLLSHPNIASAIEQGVEGNERYIVMDLLLGRTVLDVWNACSTRGIAIDLDLAAWICARVACGLHHAHEVRDEAGQSLHLIHRDVTPSNVFLTYDGDVKLFDFGLAKSRGKRHATKAGVVKGKVSYFSPEQVELVPLDRRSDIYTLGVTLWELTTMSRLFQRESDMDAIAAIRAGLVPDAREVVEEYPDELWQVVKRALAHDRDARYPTAEELARDLDRFVESGRLLPAKVMRERIGALLDDLFPGERERQDGWLQSTSIRGGKSIHPPTLPPPAPMLPMPAEAGESGSSQSRPPPPPLRSTRPPVTASPRSSTQGGQGGQGGQKV
jgi:eukaryotic-like serine/threonine-protein kinase